MLTSTCVLWPRSGERSLSELLVLSLKGLESCRSFRGVLRFCRGVCTPSILLPDMCEGGGETAPLTPRWPAHSSQRHKSLLSLVAASYHLPASFILPAPPLPTSVFGVSSCPQYLGEAEPWRSILLDFMGVLTFSGTTRLVLPSPNMSWSVISCHGGKAEASVTAHSVSPGAWWSPARARHCQEDS